MTRIYIKSIQKKKRSLNDANNHSGVITHSELDLLGCEVKWALGSIITNEDSGGDPILKDSAVKTLS